MRRLAKMRCGVRRDLYARMTALSATGRGARDGGCRDLGSIEVRREDRLVISARSHLTDSRCTPQILAHCRAGHLRTCAKAKRTTLRLLVQPNAREIREERGTNARYRMTRHCADTRSRKCCPPAFKTLSSAVHHRRQVRPREAPSHRRHILSI